MNDEKKIRNVQILTTVFLTIGVILMLVSLFTVEPELDYIFVIFVVFMLIVFRKKSIGQGNKLRSEMSKNNPTGLSKLTQKYVDEIDLKIVKRK